MIDNKDVQILKLLQKNARISNAEIARKVRMAPSGVFERLRRLEEKGVIRGYEVRLDDKKVKKGMLAFIWVRSDEHIGEMGTPRQLARIPEVQEVHHISGEDCYLVKIRIADTEELSRVMKQRFGKIRSIRSTRTTIVFETVKETTNIHLDDSGTENKE